MRTNAINITKEMKNRCDTCDNKKKVCMYVNQMKPGCCAADNGGVYTLQFKGKYREDWHYA